MSFFDENGYQININAWEKTEQDQAAAYITPECVVLELGARYGSVSCAINKNLENPRTQVSVEPDDRVWAVLQANMERNGCLA